MTPIHPENPTSWRACSGEELRGLGMVINEKVIAEVTFQPWFLDDFQGQGHWRICIQLLDVYDDTKKYPKRYFRGTITDGERQVATAQHVKPEGGFVRPPLAAVCHDLGQWYAFPDHSAYSVDWLCGFL